MKTLAFVVVTLAAFTSGVLAQAPGVPIEINHPGTGDAEILERARVVREAGKLLNIEQIKEQVKTPLGGLLELAEANRETLPGREVAARARAGYLQLGWYYLCPRCDHWHLNLAGAYAIAKDAIATCNHCIEPKLEMREGYLIAIDHTGGVAPVTGVIARSQTMDAAILRVAGGNFIPLPLNDQVAQGDSAYCFSEPLGQEGYFSAGIVNRFYWRTAKRGEPGSLDELKNLRLNVSTDWAPGSSGAAVLDAAANVIGHVSTISPLSEGPGAVPAPAPEKKSAAEKKADESKPEPVKPREDRFRGATLITLHDAVPARGVMALAQSATKMARVATSGPENEPQLRRVANDEKSDSLKIGDVAPKLASGKWIQGDPIPEFTRDKAYLVEFWATWCGPCIKGIPHLNELHQKFSDKGLVVIGQNCWEREPERVEPFVKAQGEKMSYRVALDSVAEGANPNSGAMARTWMEAADQHGIPAAFLVDKTGRVAWIGHPARLTDSMIEEVLAGKFDADKARRDAEEEATAKAAIEKNGRKLTQAMREKLWDVAEKLIGEMEATLPDNRKLMAASARLYFALGSKNAKFANEFANQLSGAPELTSEMANETAWQLVIAEDFEGLNLGNLERLARRGVELSSGANRAPVFDTLARILFRSGRKEEAMKIQQEAITAAEGDELKKELTATLDAYQKGKLPPPK